MSKIHPKITEVLTETFKVPVGEIIPEATMDSLEMDSLAVAEFAVIIKETLGVTADADSLLKGATLDEITTFLHRAGTTNEAQPASTANGAVTAGMRCDATMASTACGADMANEAYEAAVGVGR